MITKEQAIEFLNWVDRNYHFLSEDEYEPEEYPIGYDGERITFTSAQLLDKFLSK